MTKDRKLGPRDNARHRERAGAILIRVRWADVARLLGLSVHTAKKYGTGPGRKFDPHDVADVVRYLRERGG